MIDDTKAQEIIQIVSDYLMAVASGGDAEEQYNVAVQSIKNSVNEVI